MYLWPHTIKGIHIERQIIKFSFIVSYRTISVTIEFHDRVHEIPHLLVIGMENMCTILVHIDAFQFFAVDVATEM